MLAEILRAYVVIIGLTALDKYKNYVQALIATCSPIITCHVRQGCWGDRLANYLNNTVNYILGYVF